MCRYHIKVLQKLHFYLVNDFLFNLLYIIRGDFRRSSKPPNASLLWTICS